VSGGPDTPALAGGLHAVGAAARERQGHRGGRPEAAGRGLARPPGARGRSPCRRRASRPHVLQLVGAGREGRARRGASRYPRPARIDAPGHRGGPDAGHARRPGVPRAARQRFDRPSWRRGDPGVPPRRAGCRRGTRLAHAHPWGVSALPGSVSACPVAAPWRGGGGGGGGGPPPPPPPPPRQVQQEISQALDLPPHRCAHQRRS